MSEITLVIQPDQLRKLILDHARSISGFPFDQIDIEIKRNTIEKVIVWSNIKPKPQASNQE